jgi:hypothetical protein
MFHSSEDTGLTSDRQRRASQTYLLDGEENPPTTQFIQTRRYTPISISRSLAAGIIEPATNAVLAEEFSQSITDKSQHSQVANSIACSACDCSNNCFCYPVCGCQTLYKVPYTNHEFTLCPLTSSSADASYLCAGINDNARTNNGRRDRECANTICIPAACVLDLITLVPRSLIGIFASICNAN